MRYSYPQIYVTEIPGEISLGISISGCPVKCKGCHSSETWNRNFGDILTSQVLLDIIKKHKHITCVLFYGGDWKEDIDFLLHLLKIVRTIGLKTALYSGYDEINENLASMLDYYKI